MGAAKAIAATKGHRTKAEKAFREAEEKKIISGEPLAEFAEVKQNEVAHNEFSRVRKLMRSIGKNDALFSAIINRYCLLSSEIADFELRMSELNETLTALKAAYSLAEIDAAFYFQKVESINKSIASYDRQIMQKRKMMFDIEKENCMTVAAGIRTIPKKPSGDNESNPLMKVLSEYDD